MFSPCSLVEQGYCSTNVSTKQDFAYYRACPTVQEYVLIDTQRQAVEVYRRQADTLWTLHPFGPSDLVELASLSLSFPIASLYENVELPEDTPDSSSM